MERALCTIASSIEIMPGVYRMWIHAPGIAGSVRPGQFVTVRCGDLTLRRPISVHQVGSDKLVHGQNNAVGPEAIGTGESQISLLFRVTGKGTLWLAQRREGEAIDVLGPMGNGFSLPDVKQGTPQHSLLVAGGIGIAPLVFLLRHILRPGRGETTSGHEITLIHGAKTASQLYPLPEDVHPMIVTEDGSKGEKGLVTDVLPGLLQRADQIYACGPAAMYQSMAEMMSSTGGLTTARGASLMAKCQISLEVRMGCGFGACYGCTVKTRKGLKRVCLDGPIFYLDDIIWQEGRI